MSLISDYKSSLKNTQVEEILDLLIYRPLAFLLVKVLYHTPLTPNQISLIAMATGVVSGYYFSKGSPDAFLIGGLLYALSNVIDCCDGMIARLKKNGSSVGRIVDGVVDYIVSIAVYVGLAIGMGKVTGAFDLTMFGFELTPWTLVLLAGVSAAAHAIVFDFYRNEFLAHALGQFNSMHDEINEFTAELNRLENEGGSGFDKALIRIYLKYLSLQAGSEKPVVKSYDSSEYEKKNAFLLRLWSFIGSTSHITVVVIASLLYNPMIFFWYVIVFGNIWMGLVWIFQINARKV